MRQLSGIRTLECIACVVAVSSVGCGADRAPEPSGTTGQALASSAADAQASSVIPGYVHTLNASKFRIGQNPTLELSTGVLQQWRGSLGAFSTDPTNGWSMASLDSTTPRGPYIVNAATQNAAVRDYFLTAGLPADQVGPVGADFEVGGSGQANSQATFASGSVRSINSVLSRVVQGISVVESFAWAKMTTGGDVDMEAVFWPPLDGSVVNSAVNFAATMADPAMHAAYLAKLPSPPVRDGGVVIHHTDFTLHSASSAYVSYDVTLDSMSSASMRHFDVNGNEFWLPQELAANPGSIRKR
jgi:hypothetical protein